MYLFGEKEQTEELLNASVGSTVLTVLFCFSEELATVIYNMLVVV